MVLFFAPSSYGKEYCLKITHESLRDRLRLRSGKRAEKQDQLLSQKEKIVNEINSLNDEYYEICSNILPFTLCKDLIEELVISLKEGISFDKYNSSIATKT